MRFRRSDHDRDMEARLRNERPEAPDPLVNRVSSDVRVHDQGHAISRTRRSLAMVFAALALSSMLAGAAFATSGGNGNGDNGGGNGNSGTPSGCVEGNGQAGTQNPNC
jgi:hypothetical protein